MQRRLQEKAGVTHECAHGLTRHLYGHGAHVAVSVSVSALAPGYCLAREAGGEGGEGQAAAAARQEVLTYDLTVQLLHQLVDLPRILIPVRREGLIIEQWAVILAPRLDGSDGATCDVLFYPSRKLNKL